MAGSLAAAPAGQRDVQGLVRQPLRQLTTRQLLLASADRALEGILDFVDELSRLRPLGGIEPADRLGLLAPAAGSGTGA